MPKKVPQSLLQAMLLMQSKLVTERVEARRGTRVKQLLKDIADDRHAGEEAVSRDRVAEAGRDPS